jgi:hypothetical protein
MHKPPPFTNLLLTLRPEAPDLNTSRKEKICQGLGRLYKFKNIPFNMPRYRSIEKLPFISLERS